MLSKSSKSVPTDAPLPHRNTATDTTVLISRNGYFHMNAYKYTNICRQTHRHRYICIKAISGRFISLSLVYIELLYLTVSDCHSDTFNPFLCPPVREVKCLVSVWIHHVPHLAAVIQLSAKESAAPHAMVSVSVTLV